MLKLCNILLLAFSYGFGAELLDVIAGVVGFSALLLGIGTSVFLIALGSELWNPGSFTQQPKALSIFSGQTV